MKRAFTLVEVLIVTAIIAVVMAIASPVFWRAKRPTPFSADIAQLRQLHLAFQLAPMMLAVDSGPLVVAQARHIETNACFASQRVKI